MKLKLPILFLFLFFPAAMLPAAFAATQPAASEEPPKPSPMEEYLTKVSQKFDSGVVNFLIGWTEIITEPMDHVKEAENKNRVFASFLGLGEGLANAIFDTAGGFLNAATSPMPQFRIPLPENGVEVEKITG